MKFNKTLITDEGKNFITRDKDYKIFVEKEEIYFGSNNHRYYVIDDIGGKYGITESEIDNFYT